MYPLQKTPQEKRVRNTSQIFLNLEQNTTEPTQKRKNS